MGRWRQVRNCQILLVQETVVLVVNRSSRRQKTNKLKLVKQCGHQESKIKALPFMMFLKWRHSAPIFHYVVNFIGRGRSGKFKAWFHGKKSIGIQFFGFNTFLDVIVITKPQKPCWQYRHFKHGSWSVCILGNYFYYKSNRALFLCLHRLVRGFGEFLNCLELL